MPDCVHALLELYAQINHRLVRHEDTASCLMRAMEVQIQELDAMRYTVSVMLKRYEGRLFNPSVSLPGMPSRSSRG